SELIKPVGTRQIEFFEVMFDGKTAGFCYYTIYERCRTAEIATIFLPKYRGKNLSFPTISFLIKHAIRYYPELLRMEATESSSNAIAISILLSAGFKIEGVRPNGYVCGKMISDAILFGMLLGKDRNTVSSLYRFDSFKNRKKEKARLIRQGNILLKHETQLMQDVGIFDKFAHAKQIIDIGCGFGQFALWLSKKFPTVNKIIGVDPSEYMIQESEAKGRRKVSMVCSDGLKFLERLPRGKTDIVCLRFVINHIPSHLWNRWLIAVKRCLKPGGIIYLTLADANYYKTSPKLPLMDIMFKHKKLLREKNGGIWNVPSVIGGHLHTAGYNRITQQSVCLNTKDMGSHNYAVSIGDQFIWGIEDNWKKTGELTKRLLLDASKQDDFWGQVKIGIHVGEKQ
ncbi:MAG: methyltransferase domain-containing protein, partial [Elusimicrobiales bacterium]|nr:methyltransferase domain-containing protein [Elusimicrobiales bacterium]